MLISPMDGSLRLVESTSPVWHIDAVRGPSTPSLRGANSDEENVGRAIIAHSTWFVALAKAGAHNHRCVLLHSLRLQPSQNRNWWLWVPPSRGRLSARARERANANPGWPAAE